MADRYQCYSDDFCFAHRISNDIFSEEEKPIQEEDFKSLGSSSLDQHPLVFMEEVLEQILYFASFIDKDEITEEDIRNILLQCVSVKGKQVIEKRGLEIEINNDNPIDVMEVHLETNEGISHNLDDQERENARLK